MAWRTTEAAVRLIIDSDPNLAIAPFIDWAHVVTDYVESEDSDGELTDAGLAEMEKWLAGHAYAARDQLFESKKTGDASARFQGQFGKRLDSTDYGQRAMMLDFTGTLRRLNEGAPRASVAWLGRPPSEQTDYVDRD